MHQQDSKNHGLLDREFSYCCVGTLIPWQCLWCCCHAGHCESSSCLSDECRMLPSAADPRTKPTNLGHESICSITQPTSWYSFHHPTEGRRPSWHRHCNSFCNIFGTVQEDIEDGTVHAILHWL